ncbi:MAG TPA: protein-glutamate O-methyltransferase CheR [Pseudobacteroides sp.]|uniref:CheR family methyltransferase n=1 Tax=Pseudobacteroides sp. TaxID=1968840 RepID=UPI002F93E004
MNDYEWFKGEVYKLSGIDLSCYKEKQMKRRIEALIRKYGMEPYESYLQAIKAKNDMYNEFINYLTINVSEFYRNPEQWEVLKNEILPMILNVNKKPRIWSAACSTGDEPYTLAMILNNFIPLNEIRIIATDIDREILNKAQTGIYSAKSLAGLPKNYLNEYFTSIGDTYQIKESVKKCVDFKHHNLLKDPYPTDLDLIVCRNVLIYFTEEAKTNIYYKFNASLKPHGVLFVGSTEQIIMSSKFNLKSLKTFFYVKENQNK